MNKKISVIIPVYNSQKTLKSTVSSVLSCTYEPLEIILVDDGSADDSPKICDDLSEKYDNIKTCHTANSGAAAARNKGMSLASGDYFAFIDSDDIIASEYFDTLYKLIDEYDADIAVCDYKKIYEKDFKDIIFDNSPAIQGEDDNDPESGNSYIRTYCFNKKEAVKNLLYQRFFMSTPCCMISKRTLWDDLKFPEGVRAEDVATIYKLFFNADKVAFTEKKLYYYYQRRESTVYSTSAKLNPDYFNNCKDIVKFMEENMTDAVPAAYSRLFSACFQILMQTERNDKNKQFYTSIYNEIKNIRKPVLTDRSGKPRNRAAALASYLGIPFLHILLRIMYKSKTSKL